MPLLTIQSSKKIESLIKLEESTAKRVDQYAHFVKASADQVVNQALEYVFTKDKDFGQYLEEHADREVPSVLRVKKPVAAPASKKNGAGNSAANGATPHAASSK